MVSERGGAGAAALAEAVVDAAALPSRVAHTYPLAAPILGKIEAIATRVYGAAGVRLLPAAEQRIARFTADGLDQVPVCMAKTHLSLSDDATLLNAPAGFTLAGPRHPRAHRRRLARPALRQDHDHAGSRREGGGVRRRHRRPGSYRWPLLTRCRRHSARSWTPLRLGPRLPAAAPSRPWRSGSRPLSSRWPPASPATGTAPRLRSRRRRRFACGSHRSRRPTPRRTADFLDARRRRADDTAARSRAAAVPLEIAECGAEAAALAASLAEHGNPSLRGDAVGAAYAASAGAAIAATLVEINLTGPDERLDRARALAAAADGHAAAAGGHSSSSPT